MSRALFPTPLTASRQFVGTVDATHERCTPCPRTLEQAFGRAAGGVIVPMADMVPTHRAADWALYIVAVVALVVIGLTS